MWVQGFKGSKVQGSGFRVQGSGFIGFVGFRVKGYADMKFVA
jgi:hypothetical protein